MRGEKLKEEFPNTMKPGVPFLSQPSQELHIKGLQSKCQIRCAATKVIVKT